MPETDNNSENFDINMELFRNFNTHRITTENNNSETLPKTGIVPKQNDTEGHLFRMRLNSAYTVNYFTLLVNTITLATWVLTLKHVVSLSQLA